MKHVFQNQFGGTNGNCFSACIASLLELDISEVPHFCDGNDSAWLTKTNDWLKTYNLWFFDVDIHDWQVGDSLPWPGYYTVSGKGPRGVQHSVVYKDGGMIHDPHPSGGGVVPEHIGVLVPLIPPPIGRDE